MDDLTFQSAKSLARAIREKSVSAREVVEAHLRRIEEVNPVLNAVVQLAAERAESEARELDDALARGELRGPLHGVPITIKDSFDTEGIISTGGTLGRAAFVPERDATPVARLRAAGAVLLGKTNTPELTMAAETDNLVYGRTNNPFDVSRTPGGSSGGAAAIISAGGSPLDLGTDTGGSIRFPSHYCGIAGLKPTTGRVPRTGHIIGYDMGAAQSLTVVGPMARYVEDLELAFPIIAGPDYRDPHMVPMPIGDPGDVDLAGLRVAYYTESPGASPTPETVRAVRDAAAALAEAGATTAEESPSVLADGEERMLSFIGSDNWAWGDRLLERFGTTREHAWITMWRGMAKPLDTGDFTALLEEIDRFRSEMIVFMETRDLIVCPISAQPALLHGASYDEEHMRGLGYSGVYNVTGWPAAIVRVGTSPEGLPIGVQMVARPWREDVSLAAARVLEGAFGGWRRPGGV